MEKKNQKSPSLEVISKELQGNGLERRFLPRLSLATEQFRLSKSGKIFSVCDLSVGGMGLLLLDPNDFQLFSDEELIQGTLNLKRQKYEVSSRVRNLSFERIGLEFDSPSQQLTGAIQQLFDPVALGQGLRLLPSPVKDSLWYHGAAGTDLVFLHPEPSGYKRVTLYTWRNYVQWDDQKGLSTGITKVAGDRTHLTGVVRWETLLLDSDSSPDFDKLSIAKTIILSSNVTEDLKNWCKSILK